MVSRTAPVGYPAQQHCETIVLASIFGGRHVKPLKPDETVHETAWQVCETGETGVFLIKELSTLFFYKFYSGFIGFTRLPRGFMHGFIRFQRFHTVATKNPRKCIEFIPSMPWSLEFVRNMS